MVLIAAAVLFGFLAQPPLRVAQREIRENKPTYSILVKYPEISDASEFNAAARKLVDPIVDSFKSAVAKGPLPGAPPAQAYLNATYSAAVLKSGIVSVLFEWEDYTPGLAHPDGGMASINYDGRSGKVLALSDLFRPGSDYVSRLSQLAIDSLMRRQNAIDDFIRRGAGPQEGNFKVFTITDTALVLQFPTYQVGTRVDGPQKVEIPLATLTPLLRK